MNAPLVVEVCGCGSPATHVFTKLGGDPFPVCRPCGVALARNKRTCLPFRFEVAR